MLQLVVVLVMLYLMVMVFLALLLAISLSLRLVLLIHSPQRLSFIFLSFLPMVLIFLRRVIDLRNVHACVSDPNTFSSCSGDRYHIIYSPILDSNGLVQLVVSDRVDISASIQAELPFTDMNYIISRLLAGDVSVVNRSTPMFGDFSNMPKSLTEAYNVLQSAEKEFYKLDPAVRSEFNGSFTEFLAASNNSDFVSRIDNAMAAIKDSLPVSKKEVRTDAS